MDGISTPYPMEKEGKIVLSLQQKKSALKRGSKGSIVKIRAAWQETLACHCLLGQEYGSDTDFPTCASLNTRARELEEDVRASGRGAREAWNSL